MDVDTASYTNVRRFLQRGELPPAEAVRVEEMLNHFTYDYPEPAAGEAPIAIFTEVARCPWKREHRLLHVGLQTLRIALEERRPTNLVFLLDVSGSMKSERKLPLVQAGLRLLVERLDERDRVSIVTYASGVNVPLEPTPASDRATILAAIDALTAGGSTNGEGGIQRAYAQAEAARLEGGVNRIVLATDGDFNVGLSNRDQLVELIEEKAKGGVRLTVLGFGMGNLKDATLEQLADHGDGHYAYVDSLGEARRLFVERLPSTLELAAKDVKVQVEFNPQTVSAYRLVGYANRRLAAEDFNDDAKDAGDMGAGHGVTALFEIVPAGPRPGQGGVDSLRYQRTAFQATEAAGGGELGLVKVRYKPVGASESLRLERVVQDEGASPWLTASADFRLAASVALFGLVLSESDHRGGAGLADALELALPATVDDPRGEATELVDLILRARDLGLR